MKFWVAEIHEIVKNTILHYSEIRGKCNELNDALKQVKISSFYGFYPFLVGSDCHSSQNSINSEQTT
jgi:hypothetical protein